MFKCPFEPHFNQNLESNQRTYDEFLDFRLENQTECITTAEIALQNKIRMLWEEHDVWTKLTIMGIIQNSPDLNLTVDRLLRNPVDFYEVLRIFYGDETAAKFRDLLKDHLVIAGDLVKAIKSNNKQLADETEKKWYDNADQIAIFMASINSNWSEETFKIMLHNHLDLVKAEAAAILTKNYAESIKIYDEIENQSLEMADEISQGIIKQFPENFK